MKKLSVKARHAFSSQNGFTLIELLVSITILVIVLSIIYQVLGFSQRFFSQTDDLATQQNQARLIVQGLRKELGTAQSLIIDGHESVLPSAGSLALYADYAGGYLVTEDSSGKETPVYTSYPTPPMQVTFTKVSDNVIHVKVMVGGVGNVVAETDITTLNTTIDVNDPDGDNAGNFIVYVPST